MAGELMATTTYPPIVRAISPGALAEVLRRYGYGGKLGIGDLLAERLPAPDVRTFAAKLRATEDRELPDRPRVVAAAVDALCDEAEARPVDGWDYVHLSDDHKVLVSWSAQRFRSAGLVDAAESLTDLLADPAVCHARKALDVLAEVEQLLPGADAALWPVLSLYAALDITTPN